MDRFERLQVLGRGAFGVAMLVRDRSCGGRRGGLRVVKEINLSSLSPKAQREAHSEASVLKGLSHANVVAYFDYFVEDSRLHIVMEFADGGDLSALVKKRRTENSRFDQIDALVIFVQCCLALRHIHGKHVLHRDLKCQNIFLMKSGVVKLGDFGIAKVLDHTAAQADTMIGTPSYLSPEVCDNRPYGIKADVWALGIVLYEMLALEPPFKGNCLAALVVKIVTAEPKPVPSDYGEEVRALVASCLRKKPEERPSAEDLLAQPAARQGWAFLPPAVLDSADGASAPNALRSAGGGGRTAAASAGDAARSRTAAATPMDEKKVSSPLDSGYDGFHGLPLAPASVAAGPAGDAVDEFLLNPEFNARRGRPSEGVVGTAFAAPGGHADGGAAPLSAKSAGGGHGDVAAALSPVVDPGSAALAEYRRNRELAAQTRARANGELSTPRSHPLDHEGLLAAGAPASARELARDLDKQRREVLNQAAAQAIQDRKLALQQRKQSDLDRGGTAAGLLLFGDGDAAAAAAAAAAPWQQGAGASGADNVQAVKLRGLAAKEEKRRKHEAELEEARRAARDAQREMRARHFGAAAASPRGGAPVGPDAAASVGGLDSARKAQAPPRTPIALAGGLLAAGSASPASGPAMPASSLAPAAAATSSSAAANASLAHTEATLHPADANAASSVSPPLPPLPPLPPQARHINGSRSSGSSSAQPAPCVPENSEGLDMGNTTLLFAGMLGNPDAADAENAGGDIGAALNSSARRGNIGVGGPGAPESSVPAAAAAAAVDTDAVLDREFSRLAASPGEGSRGPSRGGFSNFDVDDDADAYSDTWEAAKVLTAEVGATLDFTLSGASWSFANPPGANL
eukprot:TRINITY_DN1735_c2_g1_i1.p1 TRINITY_DN1735_c2_g1~~TRINITY_DN1735_c2_g1_i1.p1  ORF type:complete len:859 (+),score=196.49 TRINITY_DN1735_c2_g1_i1:232-2808(+)